MGRFRKNRATAPWEDKVAAEVTRLTEHSPRDVTIVIPAVEMDLGPRLEVASRLMKQRGYRLRQVIPDSGTRWSVSFMRRDDD